MKTKTRLITILLILSCVFICAISITLIFAASQQNMQTDFDVEYTSPFTFTLNSDNESYSVSALSTSVSGNLTIPSTYNSKPVTTIANSGFYDCTGLTSVTIPSGVTSIGAFAFYGCTGLRGVTIPGGVTSIGYSAFKGCVALTSVTIPNSVTDISNAVFQDCTNLTNVTFGENSLLETIVAGVFYNCARLTSITIPSSVIHIDYQVFADCTSLTSVTFKNPNGWFIADSSSATSGTDLSPTDLENTATAATYLTSTYYDKSWKRIYTYTLSSDGTSYSIAASSKSLSGSITIPLRFNDKDVTQIGTRGFYDCTGLTNITIPSRVTNIGTYAFKGCTGLTSITIPSGVTSIGSNAFSGCTGLTTLEVESANTTYRSEGNCIIYRSVNALVVGCKASVIPTDGSVTSINNDAFSGCTGLTEITIPSSVTSIGARAFNNCTSLTSVEFKSTSGWFVATSSSATSGTDLSSTDLGNETTAATYLKDTYKAYYWKRT